MPSMSTAAAMAGSLAQRQAVFQQLKPICSQLLFQRSDPAAMHKDLAALQLVVQGVHVAGLLACWDYLAFPLLLITDSVHTARTLQQRKQQQQPGRVAIGEEQAELEVTVPAAQSDRVAEAALGCLLVLFERCSHGAEEDQAWAALQRLAPLLMLPQGAASEEARCLAFRCVLALLAPSASSHAMAYGKQPLSSCDAAAASVDAASSQQQPRAEAGALDAVDDFDVDAFLLTSPADVLAEEELATRSVQMPVRSAAAAGTPAHARGAGASSTCSDVGGPSSDDPLAVHMPPLSSALSAESAAPLLGYLIHACLAASEAEMVSGAGAGGSRALRLVALELLRRLMQVVSDWQALAFYLPGVVSSLAKQTYAATGGLPNVSAATGSGSGSKATALAVAGLADIVSITLSDAAHARSLPAPEDEAPEDGPWAAMSNVGSISQGQGREEGPATYDALAALKALQGMASSSSAAPAGGVARPPPPLHTPLPSSKAAPQVQQSHEAASSIPEAPVTGGGMAGRGGGGHGKGAAAGGGDRMLRVECGAAWLAGSTARVVGLLQKALPPLCNHPRPVVREALAVAAVQLLQRCFVTLGAKGRGMLLELVLVLAQDDWIRVSQPCIAWLSGQHQPSHQHPPQQQQQQQQQQERRQSAAPQITPGAPSLARPGSHVGQLPVAMLEQLVEGLLPAVRAGEAQGMLHARKLSTALLHAGVTGCGTQLLQRPQRLTHLLDALVACFAFDRAAAPLALRMSVANGGASHRSRLQHATTHTHTQPVPKHSAPGSSSSSSSKTNGLSRQGADAADNGHAGSVGGGTGAPAPIGSTTDACAQQPASAAAAAATDVAAADAQSSCVLLPRMPLCALHLGSVRCYEAVAGVARSMGHLARLADAMGVAGSHNHVRRLCDQLAHMLHAAADAAATQQPPDHAPRPRRKQGSAPAAGSSGTVGDSWQVAAAAAAGVVAEVVLGASAAWLPAFPVPDAHGLNKPEGPDPRFEHGVQLLLGQLVCEELWGAPTHNPGSLLQQQQQQQWYGMGSSWSSAEGPVESPVEEPMCYSAQALGENALLARALAECCGTTARALGPRLSAAGRLLRCMLLPLLERLADPCPLAAQAARVALDAVCSHCGYNGSLRSLLNANADYVVDALCGQLRDLGTHPRAPLLLAALLRRAGGVAPHMLPLMAEPLQAALRGLSIIARRKQPHYTHAFLAACVEVAAGAADEAADAAALSHAAARDVAARVQRKAATRRQASEEAAARARAWSMSDGPPSPTTTSARAYFTQRMRRRRAAQESNFSCTPLVEPMSAEEQAAEAELAGEEAELGWEQEGEPGAWRHKVMGTDEVEALEVRGRRLRSAAMAAAAAADAAAPLLTSADLKVCLAAMQCARTALQALHHSTPALEADQQLMEECGPKGVTRPTPPEPPKLLPTIALMWPNTMAALADARTPVVEGALHLVATLTCLGGGTFMARRFKVEAAPLLSRLLISGTAHRPAALPSTTQRESLTHIGPTPFTRGWVPTGLLLGGSGSSGSGGGEGGGAADGRDWRQGESKREGELAPGAHLRVRVGVLQCLGEVCKSPEAHGAVKGLAWGIAQACLPFMSSSHPPALQQAASDALAAVAGVDADAVWLLLMDVVLCSNSSSSSSSYSGSGSGGGCSSSGGGSMEPAQPLTPSLPSSPTPALSAAAHLLSHRTPPPPPAPFFPPLPALLKPLPPSPGACTLAPTASSSRSQHASHQPAHSSGPNLPPSFSLSSPAAPWVATWTLAAECAPRARALLANLEAKAAVQGDRAEGEELTGAQKEGFHVPPPVSLAVLVGGVQD